MIDILTKTVKWDSEELQLSLKINSKLEKREILSSMKKLSQELRKNLTKELQLGKLLQEKLPNSIIMKDKLIMKENIKPELDTEKVPSLGNLVKFMMENLKEIECTEMENLLLLKVLMLVNSDMEDIMETEL